MKKVIVIMVFTLIAVGSHAQYNSFDWALIPSAPHAAGHSLITDSDNNVYCAGEWGAWLKIEKFNSTGTSIWSKGIYNAKVLCIKSDGFDNIYIQGVYNGVADLDPGTGTEIVSGTGVFILKLNSLGNFIWAKSVAGDFYYPWYTSSSLAVDSIGNVVSIGTYNLTADFDPGPGVFNLTSVSTYVCAGEADIYIQKLDSAGNFVWAKGFGSIGGDVGMGIDIDHNGNVYTTGMFSTTADLDPGPSVYLLGTIQTNSAASAFVQKLDSNGNFQWAINMQGDFLNSIKGSSIVVDNNFIYTSGNYINSVDFDPGPGASILTWGGGFVQKLDLNGNFVWVKKLVDHTPYYMTKDNQDNLCLIGYFQDTLNFDPGGSNYTITPTYSCSLCGNIFIEKIDTTGNFVTAKGMFASQNGNGTGYSLAVDNGGNLYSTGFFGTQMDFDPAPNAVFNLSGGGNYAFLQKLKTCVPSYHTIVINSCHVYSLNNQTYYSSGTYHQYLRNATGCDSIITIDLTLTASDTTISYSGCLAYHSGGGAYTTSGTYYEVYQNFSGCDSVVTLQLIINVTHTYTNAEGCNSININNQIYNTSGVYTQILSNVNGCDSVVHFNVNLSLYTVGVHPTGGSLIANYPYQAYFTWVDCNNNYAFIPGGNSQIFTPSIPGSYAVIVAPFGASCNDTSACYTVTDAGISEQNNNSNITISPNPFTSQTTITFGEEHTSTGSTSSPTAAAQHIIKITDVLGNVMQQLTTNNKQLTLDMSDVAKGIYFVRITDKNKNVVNRKIVLN